MDLRNVFSYVLFIVALVAVGYGGPKACKTYGSQYIYFETMLVIDVEQLLHQHFNLHSPPMTLSDGDV